MASLPQAVPSEKYFKGSRHTDIFSGMQTNVAPSKYLQAVLALDGERFDKIIMLCTREVREVDYDELDGLTTVEYYKQQIREHAQKIKIDLPDDVFSVIPYDSTVADDVSEILKPIMEIMESTKSSETHRKLYIDFTSGTRTASMALVFAARFLAAHGIETANIIYANLVYGTGNDADHPAPIEECIKTYDTFEYFAGLVEKEVAGKVHRLLEFTKKYGMEEQVALLKKANINLDTIKAGQATEKIDHEPIDTGDVLVDEATEGAIKEANVDKWGQIDYALKRKDTKHALNLLKNDIMELLNSSGKLEYIGDFNISGSSELAGLVELTTNHWYYGKYIKYVKSLLEHLHFVKKPPTEAAKAYMAKTYKLSHYRRKEYAEQVEMTPRMSNIFNEQCSEEIREIQDFFAANVNELIKSGNKISGEIISELVSEYNNDLLNLQNVYFTEGFPFAFVIKPPRRNMKPIVVYRYNSLYKEALNRSIDDINTLYYGKEGVTNRARLVKAFNLLKKDRCSYAEFLELVKHSDDVIKILFPMQYNTKNFKSRVWKEKWMVSEFLNDFMPIYIEVRDYRNKIMYEDKLTPEEIEIVLEKSRKCLDMLRPPTQSD